MNMGSLPPLDPLAPQTLHTYSSCGIGQWQKEEKSSSLKLDATNLILRLRQRCETRTFEASRESSPAPSGPAAASSSRSLNPAASGKRRSKIKHRTSRGRANRKQIGPGTEGRFVRGALAGSLLPPPPTCKKRRSSVSEQLRGEAKSRLAPYPEAWPTSRWRDLSARGSIRRFLGGLTCSSSPLPSPARSSTPSEPSE